MFLFMTAVVPHFYLWWQWCQTFTYVGKWCHTFTYVGKWYHTLMITMPYHWEQQNRNLPISNCLYHFNCENQVITGVLTTPPPSRQQSHYSRRSPDYAFHRCIINDPLQSSSPCYVFLHYILHPQDNNYFVFYNEWCSNVIPSFNPPSKIYLWLHFKEHV